MVSVYALCSLFSTPVIGRLSDQFGRRRLLMLSQAGTCLGFIVLGNADALWMVYLGRVLDGITAGNLSTAQAYISDHTAPETRAKAFGVIGIAFGVPGIARAAPQDSDDDDSGGGNVSPKTGKRCHSRGILP